MATDSEKPSVVHIDPRTDQYGELKDQIKQIQPHEDALGETGDIRAWVIVIEREHEGARWIETGTSRDVYMREVMAMLMDAAFTKFARLHHTSIERTFQQVTDSDDEPEPAS